MHDQIECYVKTCHNCQLSKKQRKKYGHLPPKQAETIPWQWVNVDLIGPYTIKTPNKVHTLQCMTMIDPATSWFEIAHIRPVNLAEMKRLFDTTWLSRYPHPQEVGYDNGSEFKKCYLAICAIIMV